MNGVKFAFLPVLYEQSTASCANVASADLITTAHMLAGVLASAIMGIFWWLLLSTVDLPCTVW